MSEPTLLHRDRLAEELVGRAGVVAQRVGDVVGLPARVADRLADVARFEQRQLLGVRAHEIREAEQDLGARHRGQSPPTPGTRPSPPRPQRRDRPDRPPATSSNGAPVAGSMTEMTPCPARPLVADQQSVHAPLIVQHARAGNGASVARSPGLVWTTATAAKSRHTVTSSTMTAFVARTHCRHATQIAPYIPATKANRARSRPQAAGHRKTKHEGRRQAQDAPRSHQRKRAAKAVRAAAAKRAATAPTPSRTSRRAIFIDVENTSSEVTLLRVLEHLAGRSQGAAHRGDRHRQLEIGRHEGGAHAGEPGRAAGAQCAGAGRARLERSVDRRHRRPLAGARRARRSARHRLRRPRLRRGARRRRVGRRRAAIASPIGTSRARPPRRTSPQRPAPHRQSGAPHRAGAAAAAAGVDRLSSRTPARPRPGATAAPSIRARPRPSTPRRTPHRRNRSAAVLARLTGGDSDTLDQSRSAANALKAEGFSRPPGSPRLITRVRSIKGVELNPNGMVRLVSEDGRRRRAPRATPTPTAAGDAAPAARPPRRRGGRRHRRRPSATAASRRAGDRTSQTCRKMSAAEPAFQRSATAVTSAVPSPVALSLLLRRDVRARSCRRRRGRSCR